MSENRTPAGLPPLPPLAAAKSRPPKAKRVTFILEASTRARNRHGADCYSQILWMRLDGLRIEQIAAALDCSTDLVGEVVNLWQTQIALREGDGFKPRARNPKRAKDSSKPPQAPPLRLAA